ncbi:LCP family protein [Candidatus Gottesmanbacteria bacterium]|nr:LCP family protein [Candidatus Gottesmanbacteria bacterium]
MQKIKRRLLKYSHLIKPIITVFLILFVLVILYKILFPIYIFVRDNKISPQVLSSLLFNSSPPLTQTNGRTNLVILGIAGGNHEGPYLTDSIIFMSLNLQNQDTLMLSIPRDIYLSTLKDKINIAYETGEKKKRGGGLILSKATIEEVVGQPIHYAWVVDFSGFQKLIDLVGGLDIQVERSFEDNEYPIAGKENADCKDDKEYKCRYETLHFEAGLQHMDGETALKFVRSRHAQGDEGTDFARGKRQQKVILTLKDKILQTDKKDIGKIKSLLQSFDQATQTDMNWGEILLLGKVFETIKTDQIKRPVLDSTDEINDKKGFLVNPPLWEYDGQWVLIPRTGEDNFEEIHQYIDCWLEQPKCSLLP